MIKLATLSANKTTFHGVQFKPDVNFVIADRSPESRDVDTRNGAGKTTLLQIVDFCLGSRLTDWGTLPKLAARGWEFTLEMWISLDDRWTLLGVTRAVDEPNKLRIRGDLSLIGLAEEGDSAAVISAGIWTDWLGARAFGIDKAVVREDHQPSFRQLITHFLRYRNDAYNSPFETFSRQPPVQIQTVNSFLLQLDWRLAGEWQQLKDKEKRLDVLGRQDVDEVAEEIAEMESSRARLDARLRRLRKQVAEFRVLDEYRDVEVRANEATSLLQALSNSRAVNRRLLTVYQTQLNEIAPNDLGAESIAEAFAKAQIELGDLVVRRLQDVVRFHEQIARNRSDYLASEVRRLERVDSDLGREMESVEASRQSDLQLLSSSGAIDDFGALQQRVGQVAAELEATERRIQDLRQLRSGKAELKIEKLDLQERVARDLDERRLDLGAVASDFSEIFEMLYDEPADLTVDAGPAGYRFKTNLPRSGSHGVDKIAIFAFDLAVISFWSSQGQGPGVLLHDSVLFDGVDERQVAKAMALVMQRSRELGFQYVLTLNSDHVPIEDLSVAAIDHDVVLELSDKSDEGRILGVRV